MRSSPAGCFQGCQSFRRTGHASPTSWIASSIHPDCHHNQQNGHGKQDDHGMRLIDRVLLHAVALASLHCEQAVLVRYRAVQPQCLHGSARYRGSFSATASSKVWAGSRRREILMQPPAGAASRRRSARPQSAPQRTRRGASGSCPRHDPPGRSRSEGPRESAGRTTPHRTSGGPSP